MKLTSASPAYWIALAYVLSICVTGVRADAQSHGGSPLSVAIEQISRGDFDDGAIGVILQYHGGEAVPVLQKQFELASANDWPLEERKDNIAVALVELHAEGDVYWNYLAARVQFVLDCDASDPFVYDAQGKVVPGRFSPQFGDWAKEHHVDPGKMAATIFEDFPERILRLASTGDSRGVPLLRNALTSRFPIVQVEAAAGLAKLHDNASVPLVIDAYKRGGSDTRFAFAMMALIYFDDPAAQQLAKSVLPSEVFKELMERDRSKGPF